MSRGSAAPPDGYVHARVGDVEVVARAEAMLGIRDALGVCRTLHAWAATLPGATAHEGRATAWGAQLPGTDLDVVVRHAQHGGLLAPVTGDLFLRPGRAPWELEASRRLRAAGVPTPELVAYLLYPAGPFLCRCDVATRRLPAGADLPEAWTASDETEREGQLVATAALLRLLARAGAHHPDLNAKNVYLSRTGGSWTAFVLDVDRVRFEPAGVEVASRNLARLQRSLRKHRAAGLAMTDDQVARLAALAGEGA